MRILMLIGSYRRNGNTAGIAEILAEKLGSIEKPKGTKVEIDTVYLAHEDIEMCRGCRICFDKGEDKCPLGGSIDEIRTKIDCCDGVVLLSPVYVEDVSGCVKTWIDRMAYVCHRPAFYGKFAYFITTSGGGSSNHALRTMSTALRVWGFYIAGQEKFKTGAFMNRADMGKAFGRALDRTTAKVFKAFNKRHSPSFFSLLTFKIQQTQMRDKDKSTFDFAYWDEKGWLDKRRLYYDEDSVNRLNAFFARAAGTLINKLFLK